MRRRSKLPRDVQTGSVRQHHIKKDGVGLQARDQISRAGDVSRFAHHIEPRREQHEPREPSEARVVIDDQHLDSHRRIVARGPSGKSPNPAAGQGCP